MAGQENQQYTVLYGRLSQEDERAGESNSIQHQRTLLEKYAKEKGFENTIFLADDGYSGTNFERPAWKKIVYTLTFPLFMLTYLPISLAALFMKVEWKPIHHSVNLTTLPYPAAKN